MSFYVPGQTITVETLETALDRLAVIMSESSDGGETYLPIWQRIERELAALRNQDDALAAMRARLARLSPDRRAERSSANSPAAI